MIVWEYLYYQTYLGVVALWEDLNLCSLCSCWRL
jgi:hypothetical protein